MERVRWRGRARLWTLTMQRAAWMPKKWHRRQAPDAQCRKPVQCGQPHLLVRVAHRALAHVAARATGSAGCAIRRDQCSIRPFKDETSEGCICRCDLLEEAAHRLRIQRAKVIREQRVAHRREDAAHIGTVVQLECGLRQEGVSVDGELGCVWGGRGTRTRCRSQSTMACHTQVQTEGAWALKR